jgi:hypothetical protein
MAAEFHIVRSANPFSKRVSEVANVGPNEHLAMRQLTAGRVRSKAVVVSSLPSRPLHLR